MNVPHKSAWVVETNDDRFEEDVLRRSSEIPVVVDFWAEWCQPCRMLGPVLEQLAAEYAGDFVLVKADTEQTPVAAAQFRVQSIPAVYGVRNGTVVDGFLGAMPADEIRAWLTRFLPSEAERLIAEAVSLRDAEPEQAEERLRAAIATDPSHSAAPIALADFLAQQERFAEAKSLIVELERRGFLEPEAERIKAAIERHDQGAAVGNVDECRARVGQEPDNLSRKLDLAEALAAAESYEESLQLCLEAVQGDRGALRERARQIMVDIFRLLPDDSDLVGAYRRKLSMALYQRLAKAPPRDSAREGDAPAEPCGGRRS